jgi:rod shape-determining protein MreD
VKRIAGLGLILALTLVQVTWAPRLEVAGAFPNLVLCAVIAITWTLGVRAGLVWACVGGVLLDLTASGSIGPHALALLAGAYVTGFWTRNVEHANAIHLALTGAASTVLYSTVLVVIAGLLGLPVPDPLVAARLTLAAAVYNAILVPFAHDALRRVLSLTRSEVEST